MIFNDYWNRTNWIFVRIFANNNYQLYSYYFHILIIYSDKEKTHPGGRYNHLTNKNVCWSFQAVWQLVISLPSVGRLSGNWLPLVYVHQKQPSLLSFGQNSTWCVCWGMGSSMGVDIWPADHGPQTNYVLFIWLHVQSDWKLFSLK